MITSSCATSTRPSDNDAIAFLERLVGIYSPSTRERPVAEVIVETMGRLGYDAEIDAVGNAVGRMGRGDRHVLLLGHIDTVPGEIDVRRDGDLLYGRGTVDAKGPFATFVMAAARVGALPDTQVTVVGAVEEEAATSKGAYHVAGAYDKPDYLVIGEPSAWNRITIGYKGRLLIDYHLERPMSHTAGQVQRVCEAAVDYWIEVLHCAEAYNRDKAGSFSTLDPSLRGMRSGSDGLLEWVDMHIGLRLPMGLDIDEFIEKAQGAWRGEAQVVTRAYEPPIRAPKRNALTSAFLSAIRAEGAKAAFVTKTGTSDMNVLGSRWDIPIAAYGPGDSSLDHTPKEHIDLGEYLNAIRVLARVLERLASV